MASAGNNNLRNHIVMSKYIKFYALVGATLLLGACQEDLGLNTSVPVPGDEIVFGANAYFENGEPQTRTEYGDIVGNQIEVRWSEKDRLDIGCPQSAGPRTVAEYQVATASISGETSGSKAEDSYSNTLVRLSEGAGLQWSTAPEHKFYAVYPSSKWIGEKLAKQISAEEISALGLTLGENTATLKGYIPVVQNPINTPTLETVGGKKGYVVEPDMTYAYMTAMESVDNVDNVGLTFNSHVTALQFQILPGDFAPNTSGEICIVGVNLYSANSNNIAGHFTYDYASEAFTDDNEIGDGHEKITMSFTSANNSKGIEMTKNGAEFIDVTFFLMPNDLGYNEDNGDLKLTVMYTVNDNPRVNTATLIKEIEPKKKYFFKNIKMPTINDVTGSTWFSAINPKTYVSQISIPVAGNAFSYAYNGANPKYHRQQTQNYQTLWSLGVRGFEFKCSYPDVNGSLKDQLPVCNGKTVGSVTLGNAVQYLYNQLQNPDYKNETCIIIANYQSYSGDNNDGVNVQNYLDCLTNFLDGFCTENGITDKSSAFTKLESSSCAGDIRGKIAIIVRPGDHDLLTKVGSTKDYALNDDWKDYISVINNWGTGIDQWDKRYGSTYYTEGSFATSGKTEIEQYIPWAVSTSATEFIKSSHKNANERAGDKSKFASPLKTGYYMSVNGVANQAYMQCWERISASARYYYSGSKASSNLAIMSKPDETFHLNFFWPESLSEKMAMISDVIAKAQATKGKTGTPLFINSLSGYFITENLPSSIYPYDETSYNITDGVVTDVGKLGDKGTGGDWASCAATINIKLWQELIGQSTEAGPLGIVIMDYIGANAKEDFAEITGSYVPAMAETASTALPRLIMMNNFSFPLSTNPEWTEPDENNNNNGGNTGSSKGEIAGS